MELTDAEAVCVTAVTVEEAGPAPEALTPKTEKS